MTTAFDESFTALIGNEGGYSNNLADPGGETMWGITARVARAEGYQGAMRALPMETAKAIAKRRYWDVALCDEIDQRVAFQVFDAIYNGGPAIKWLQLAAGAHADGVIGPATLAAVRMADPLKVLLRFNAYRLKYLGDLKTWPVFGHGWANRIADNLLKGGA
jgi:lysozyme family protein